MAQEPTATQQAPKQQGWRSYLWEVAKSAAKTVITSETLKNMIGGSSEEVPEESSEEYDLPLAKLYEQVNHLDSDASALSTDKVEVSNEEREAVATVVKNAVNQLEITEENIQKVVEHTEKQVTERQERHGGKGKRKLLFLPNKVMYIKEEEPREKEKMTGKLTTRSGSAKVTFPKVNSQSEIEGSVHPVIPTTAASDPVPESVPLPPDLPAEKAESNTASQNPEVREAKAGSGDMLRVTDAAKTEAELGAAAGPETETALEIEGDRSETKAALDQEALSTAARIPLPQMEDVAKYSTAKYSAWVEASEKLSRFPKSRMFYAPLTMPPLKTEIHETKEEEARKKRR